MKWVLSYQDKANTSMTTVLSKYVTDVWNKLRLPDRPKLLGASRSARFRSRERPPENVSYPFSLHPTVSVGRRPSR